MSEAAVLYSVENNVALITLNRPQARNACNEALLQGLSQAVNEAAADDAVKVVILTGNGKGFCAGADLAAKASKPQRSTKEVLNEVYKPILMQIATMEKPVISAVNGAAAGVGSAFAMVCDLTIMADDAYILEAFSNISLIPDGGATWLLTEAIGYKRAYQLAVEAERVSAQRCLEMGLCNKVVAAEDLLTEALAWGQRLCLRAPLSLGLTKKAMRQAAKIDLGAAISYEADIQNDCIQSSDFKEGVTAFFEKRTPHFSGK